MPLEAQAHPVFLQLSRFCHSVIFLFSIGNGANKNDTLRKAPTQNTFGEFIPFLNKSLIGVVKKRPHNLAAAG